MLKFREMPCDACSDFITVIRIETVESLKVTASLIEKRELRHLGPSSGDKLSDWWFDLILEYFSCRHCGQVFRLQVEAYHGSGGVLEPISETVQNISERLAASKVSLKTFAQSKLEIRKTKTLPQEKFGQFWRKFRCAIEIGLATVGFAYLGFRIINLLFQLFSD